MIDGQLMGTIYLYLLIACTVISFFLFLFGDIFDFDGVLDPMLIVPWIAFTSLFGIIGENFFTVNSMALLCISGILAFILVALMNFYVLMPLRNAESSISSSEKEFEGRKATVITPIPIEGMGEIKIVNVTGVITRPARFYEKQEVEAKAGSDVLIIEINERICYVVPYQENFI